MIPLNLLEGFRKLHFTQTLGKNQTQDWKRPVRPHGVNSLFFDAKRDFRRKTERKTLFFMDFPQKVMDPACMGLPFNIGVLRVEDQCKARTLSSHDGQGPFFRSFPHNYVSKVIFA